MILVLILMGLCSSLIIALRGWSCFGRNCILGIRTCLRGWWIMASFGRKSP